MATKKFPVIQIDPEMSIGDEALGTKSKFWIEYEGYPWLFKEARENTGEDWSEKLAAEIAHLASIPAATVEMACCEERHGTISKSFVDTKSGEGLVHGNEILGGHVLEYDPDQRWGQSSHTVANISSAIRGLLSVKAEADNALQELASCLVLDGLIINTDRHHENWGVIASWDGSTSPATPKYRISPSFDHASSLGRELREDKVKQKLADPNGVINYIKKGKGAIYINQTDKKGENPLKLVERGVERYPQYFCSGVNRIKAIDLSDILELVDRIPSNRISQNHIEFVTQFLTYTYQTLCKLKT